MDKLIFSVAQDIAPKEPMVVRLDNEASSMLYDIMCKTSSFVIPESKSSMLRCV